MALYPRTRFWQRRGNNLETAPSVEPVTAEELRTYLRETTTGLPDSEADDFIAEARQLLEDQYNIAYILPT